MITLLHTELLELDLLSLEWVVERVPMLDIISMGIIYIISFHHRIWRDIICMDHLHRYRRLHMDMLPTERLVW